MKSAIFSLCLFAFPLMPAFADFDPKGEISCQTQDGKKILLNSSFSGSGHALVSGSNRSLYLGALPAEDGRLSLLLSSGSRALAPELVIRLDLPNSELTTRKEGEELAQYYFVPAEVVTTHFWKGEQSVPAKCFQALK